MFPNKRLRTPAILANSQRAYTPGYTEASVGHIGEREAIIRTLRTYTPGRIEIAMQTCAARRRAVVFGLGGVRASIHEMING
jgi:hypothetical protein